MVLTAGGRFVDDRGKRLSEMKAYQRFVDVVTSAWLVYGHNIRTHDLPMLNAWLVHRLHMPSLPRLYTTDTLRDLPRTAGVSRSLENLAEWHELDGSKLKMSQRDWEHANRLRPDGVAKARERVVSDVVLQERLRERLIDRGVLGNPRWWRP